MSKKKNFEVFIRELGAISALEENEVIDILSNLSTYLKEFEPQEKRKEDEEINLEGMDKELANTIIDMCDFCKKKIHWWQYNGNYFSGNYHKKCFDKKFANEGKEKESKTQLNNNGGKK